MNIGVVGVNHNLAPINVREVVSFTDTKKIEAINILLDKDINEVVILSTCNRSEIYIHAENIEDKVNGAIFESGNSKELAEKIDWIFSLDEQEYDSLVKNSIEKSKEFDIDKYYTKIMDIYNEVISKTKNK